MADHEATHLQEKAFDSYKRRDGQDHTREMGEIDYRRLQAMYHELAK